MTIPDRVLDSVVSTAREVLKDREAATLLGLSPDKTLFTRADRDTVWRHLSANGICCARVDKHDKRNAVVSPTIVVARDDAELAAELEYMQVLVAKNSLVGVVSMEVIHDA